jgi:hypothetical protein
MQVFYRGLPDPSHQSPPRPQGEGIKLLSDNRDDYGFKTSFLFTWRLNVKIRQSRTPALKCPTGKLLSRMNHL